MNFKAINFKAIDFKAVGIKVLKSLIPLILIAAIAFSLFYVASSGDEQKYSNITDADYELGEHNYVELEDESIPECIYGGFKPVAQNDRFIMYLHENVSDVDTMYDINVAIYDKVTKRTITSIVPDEELKKAAPIDNNYDAKAKLLSNFVLNAVRLSDGSTTEFSTYDSLSGEEGGQVKVESLADGSGIRVTYLIGKIPKTYILPEALTEKRFNEIMEALYEVDFSYGLEFEDRYRLIVIEDYVGEERDELVKKYPKCETENIYYIPETRDFILESVQEALVDGIGYTEEQKAKDEAQVLANVGQEDYTVFKIPMEFRLHEDNFSVTVDRSGIRYSDAALPISIEVCPNIMRAYSDENGYMLFPDGTGSLLKLNNGKTHLSESYQTQIYGEDPLYYDNFTRVEDVKAQLPVFGIKSQNGGMLAYISDCAEEATLLGRISGKTSKTNTAVARFKLFGFVKEMVLQDWTATGGSGTIYNNRIHGKTISGKCTTNFYFLEKNKCEYSDMAVL